MPPSFYCCLLLRPTYQHSNLVTALTAAAYDQTNLRERYSPILVDTNLAAAGWGATSQIGGIATAHGANPTSFKFTVNDDNPSGLSAAAGASLVPDKMFFFGQFFAFNATATKAASFTPNISISSYTTDLHWLVEIYIH